MDGSVADLIEAEGEKATCYGELKCLGQIEVDTGNVLISEDRALEYHPAWRILSAAIAS